MAVREISPSLGRRIKQYLVFRLFISALGFLLVTVYVAFVAPELREATCIYLYSLLGFQLMVAVLSFVTFSRWKHRSFLLHLQVLIDFAVQSLLIWSTGGVVSIFCPVLFVSLAATAGILSVRGTFVLATMATLFLGGATLLYALGLIPATSSWSGRVFAGESSSFVVSFLLASVLALYAISTLGSKLFHGLRHVEHLQEEILENMAEGLLAIDQDGRVFQLNSEARKLLGLPDNSEDYRKKLFQELVTSGGFDSRNQEAWRELFHAFAFGRKRRFETTLVDDTGVEHPVEVKISSVLDDQGQCRCRIALVADLSLKREVEAAERRIQKLEELQVMAVGIAHEIRNPLASIRGCVQEIAHGGAEAEVMKRFAGIVMRESDRLDRIIEDFMRYARSAPVDLKPLDLVEVISQAVLLIKSRPEHRDKTLKWEPPGHRPRVYGDQDHLIQVFLNLGLNAMQASPDEGGVLEIQVHPKPMAKLREQWNGEGRPRVDGVEIAFQDNGSGIKSEELGKVFTPFFTTKEDGSGLGLSIVERFVREHSGLVDIESPPGKGTVVRIRLPVLGDSGAEEGPTGAGLDREKVEQPQGAGTVAPSSPPVGESLCHA